MAESASDVYPKILENVVYSSHSVLNTLDICIPRPGSEKDPRKIWVIYIHGGAWRDPLITSTSFKPSLRHLLSSPTSPSLAALASLNYRLSPHPSHAPTSAPDQTARSARHPDHINDVLDALAYLQRTYGFGDRYVLVGHSCGATLALQVGMGRGWGGGGGEGVGVAEAKEVIPPLAIVGLEGIYDVPALVRRHADMDGYREFVAGAFGDDEGVWRRVSPTGARSDDTWATGRCVVLAHSRGDELVEWEQVEAMREVLHRQGWEEYGRGRRLVMLEVSGNHDEVWEDGKEVAEAIGCAVQNLLEMEG